MCQRGRADVSSFLGDVSTSARNVSTLAGDVSSFWGDVFSFPANVFTFRPNVFSFTGDVFSFRGQVFNFRRRAAWRFVRVRGEAVARWVRADTEAELGWGAGREVGRLSLLGGSGLTRHVRGRPDFCQDRCRRRIHTTRI